ncbi:ORF6N domain-containing protein [Sulfurimonas sp. NW15]|uniref:ORF6N domain-containing protein n=1 Tax=Sulfurimonas sp. NW15 TaxID=2922729 RepID=UPI003DA85639
MNDLIIDEQNIQNKIYTLRGVQVMLDRDLAELYGVKSIRLREQVKRNIKRFPEDFMFQLEDNEIEFMVSQNAIPSKQHLGGAKPYVFTEQGVSMLSAVLKTNFAIEMSVQIIRAFVKMKSFLSQNANLFAKIEQIEKRQLSYEIKTDEKIDKIFKAIEDKSIKPTQGIFYDGQIFDAYEFIATLIKSAKKEIKLIDNYVDETVLTLFSKNQNTKVTIYTKTISKQLKLDLEKYNSQYNPIEIKKFENSHDRFLIIDEKEIYHIGASLKDLGKKWFAFSKMDSESLSVLERLT